MRTIAVIQARMGSTRLPGKVLELIEGQPIVGWTIAAVRATPGLDEVVVATTEQPEDDRLVESLRAYDVRVHRGPTHDVLHRITDAVKPLDPDVVLRQTADNPFVDPELMAAQLARLAEGPFDYVGIAGLPFGIGGEAVRATALFAADREATELADREHVLPFIYARPDRFAIGSLDPAPAWRHPRYTVDTPADLAFARAVAHRLPDRKPPAHLADLEAIVRDGGVLGELNAAIAQRGSRHAELKPSNAGRER
ncbi:MAG TPA: NTP transferase domain-containing protein [Candidatus Limnocylindrales bacterium]|nr:NTP transferase domain-containing protein [Candidatus Limnocylindrales bacterium]